MKIVFEVTDKIDRKIHLSKERWSHIQRHPHMHCQLENIKLTIQNSLTIRYFFTNKITGLKWETK